ncbi:NAD(P)/FAD-dependent oxidoreductase [Noviherbaspirillum aerium]|uniref:NAD(P)/FAD-dependent oxidoreductase n=1 Tax=Noviherbaspirillum aerium TaxID=2588497 RepID=UPI00124F2919|nr:FAD-dependent oxidoreductase [Noviherbaspirillum aerium]
MKPIIIVGTGLAGYTVAREFRKLDKTTPLFILTADDGGFYSKPMLSNAVAQGKQAAQLTSFTAAQMAGQLGATIITGTRVIAIDSLAKTVEAGAGKFGYDKLILAVGARAVRPPLEGNAADDVISVNHIDDYAAFRRTIGEPGSRIAIIGAGLIGCEFADDLAASHRITLIDPNALPLASLAPPALSRGLQAALAHRGVDLRLGTTVRRVDRDAKTYTLTLADGRRLQAEAVLSAVGVRPDLRLAQGAALQTGRGILVDAYGMTSAPDVFALGDCAEYTGSPDSGGVMPYIAPLMSAARAIARTLADIPTAMDLKPAPVIVKTPSYPMALLPLRANAGHGTWQESRLEERTICRHYDADGVMTAFGVAPQEAGIRQALLAELGSRIGQAA